MATSMPWSVKGVDPRTRDAAKTAARRAGMTLGEWLDHKIREESEADGAQAEPVRPVEVIAPKPQSSRKKAPEQLDIAALSERLAKLSQGDGETSAAATVASQRKAAPPSPDIEVVIRQAANIERMTREAGTKTAGALDSITRWIERTEDRISASERSAAERQERATAVIAEAIKSMGERLVEIERRGAEQRRDAPAAEPQARPTLDRGRLAAVVTDIRSRQRMLDDDATGPARAETRVERPVAHPVVPQKSLSEIEAKLAGIGSRLERLDRSERFEPLLQPLARIESEVARLSQNHSDEGYRRFELEISHLAAKVDALATRGGDRTMLAPVLRDIGELRQMLAQSGDGERLEKLSQQIADVSFEVSRLRDHRGDGHELRELSAAIEDVRAAILSDRRSDTAPLIALSRQVEQLAGKLDTLPAMRPDVIEAQADQLAARLQELVTGFGRPDEGLPRRIEALVVKLEDIAQSARPSQLEDRIEKLQQRIEILAEQGPAGVSRQIEALAGRIESLAASNNLNRMVAEGPAAAVDLTPIETMLRKLADKIDEAGRPGAESEAFDALERQMSGIASRLDAAVATRSAESGMERTLQDLVVHLRSMRDDTTDVAERAARAAVSDMAVRQGDAGEIAELSTLVSGLRDTHLSSGRDTQTALGAVHQTLETIISRLSSLEAELSGGRGTTPAPVAAKKAPAMPKVTVASEDRLAAKAPVDQAKLPVATPLDLDFDIPLEPGSGRPKVDAALASGADPQAIRQNLIAAARRSAKAATEAAAEQAPAEAKGGGRSLKDIVAKRKKPLLLGLAALVLAMGTAHLVTGAMKGEPGDAAPTPIAPLENGNTAQPAPSAEDKSSALPPATKLASEAAPSQAPQTQAPAPVAAQPTPQPVQAVTGIGDLPATLGTPAQRKAAMEGDAKAVYELAARAADGPGTSRDPKLALRLFERAAVAGLAPAQFRVGNIFEKGIGTNRDIALARVWYMRAAERGNAKAMHNLAVLHAEGISGKPDYEAAVEWFRKAADHGVRDSQYNLAVLLGRGLGAPVDLTQSYLWFAVAASQGDEDAAKKRDETAQRLSPTDLTVAQREALAWKPRPLDAEANEVLAQKPSEASPSAAMPQKPARQARL